MIELLVVVAIISVLAAMLLPSLSRATAMTRRVACASNQRQLGLGLMSYATENDGWYMQSIYNTQAVIYPNDYQDAADYFGGTGVFLCPDSDFAGPNDSYRPPKRYWAGGKWRITTYRFIGSWAVSSQWWMYYGMHVNGIQATRHPELVSPMIPNERFADTTHTDPVTGYTAWMASPERQPLVIDGFHLTNPTWTTYASGHESYNSHPRFNGMNIAFVEGHVEWKRRSGPRRMYSQGAGGWLYWAE